MKGEAANWEVPMGGKTLNMPLTIWVQKSVDFPYKSQ